MGCQSCKKKSQIDEPLIDKKEKEEEKEEIDIYKFNFEKALKLIKLLLSEDPIYHKALNYIILFNEEELENLFLGNYEYKKFQYRNIQDEFQFKRLLYKFEDFNSILFEWYQDETKYDNLIKLWKNKDCITLYKEYSDEKLEEEFRKLGISDLDNFKEEFRNVNNNSAAEKACDIKNYLRDNYDDFYSLIKTSLDYKKEMEKSSINKKKMEKSSKNEKEMEKSSINEEEIYTINLENISKKLVKESFPLIKNFILKKYPNLNIFSKFELMKSEMFTNLHKKIFGEIVNEETSASNGIGYNSISQLIDNFKNGNLLNGLLDQAKSYYNTPIAAYSNLGMSFLNLATSIKDYYDNQIELDDLNNEMKNKFDELDKNFEKHKNEIGVLDLDNYEECLNKIKIVGKKLYQDKIERREIIDTFSNKKKEVEKEKEKEKMGKMLKYGGACLGSAVGVIATGGILAGIWATSAIVNGIATGVSFYNLQKMKEKLKLFQENLDNQNKKYEEINDKINELKIAFDQLHIRYVPKNLLNENK